MSEEGIADSSPVAPVGEDQGYSSLDTDPGNQLTDLVQQDTDNRAPLLNNNVRGEAGALDGWLWSDNEHGQVVGDGSPPDWFNSKTFKTVEEQAKAHTQLRKLYNDKLKGLSGAPEEGYAYDLPKEFVDKGYTYDTSNPYYKDFLDICKSNEVSQDMVNQMTDMLVESVNAETLKSDQDYDAHIDNEYSQLTNGDKDQFEVAVKMAATNPHVDRDSLNQLLEEIQTAGAIKAFTTLVNEHNYANIPGPESIRQKDSWTRQNELRDRLQSLDKLKGQQRENAKKALYRDYEDEYPGERDFG